MDDEALTHPGTSSMTPPPTADGSDGVDTLYVNGHILGANLTEVGQAMLVGAGSILMVGSGADAQRYRDTAREVVDLDGGVVTAAFVDAHVHLSATGAALRGLDLSDARSLNEALSRVEAAGRRNGGRPLLVQNWDDTTWPEQRAFTARELDRASYGGVVYAPRVDGHSAVVSSALAAAAGLNPWGMPDGRVVTDDHHRVRAAFEANVTPGQRRDDIALALHTAASRGIAWVHENGGPVVSSAEDFDDVAAVASNPSLPRTVSYWAQLVSSPGEVDELQRVRRFAGLAGDLNIDGSIGSRTASLRADYSDAPGTSGNAFLGIDEVRDHVVACTRARTQAGFHVIGDAGVDVAIAGLEAAAEVADLEDVRGRRHRLEHVEMISADGAARLARLGVVVSMQPVFERRWGGATGMYATRLGARRAHRMNPFRTLLDAGVTIALGSDSPVTPMAPWEAVRAAVRHHDEQERITAVEAFVAHTAGGTTAAQGVGPATQLRAGASADFVVWDDSHSWFDELALDGPPPAARRTVCLGNVVHDEMT